MRKTCVVLSLVLVVLAATSVAAQSKTSPDALLERGLASYRANNYRAAVEDLEAATQGFLSPADMERYVNTGRFESLQSFERALVYLTLAHFRLGNEDAAREAIMRVVAAERISPTYAALPLDRDAAEFDSLVAALTPSAELPRNIQLAGDDPNRPLPPVTRAPETRAAVKKTLAEEKAERQKAIDELVARERERIQREADVRIAQEKAAADRAAAERIAAAQREAEQRITATQTDAQSRIAAIRDETQKRVDTATAEAKQRVAAAAAEAEEQIRAAQKEAQARAAAAVAEANRAADARIAEIQRLTEQRVAAERAEAEREASVRVTQSEAAARREYLMALRQAEAAANNAQVDEAVRLYSGLANSTNVPREVLGEAAVGLYRVGSFREAVQAFRRFGTFAKGEEDLRYYHAVALYETGNYDDAQKELACALPFIQVTEDVTRYRAKIEKTAQQRAMK